jgi:hypothetical protein
MFYKGQKQSSGRSSVLPRDATEITPMAGYVSKSSGRSLYFTCNTSEQGNKRMQGPGIMLAIRGYCILKNKIRKCSAMKPISNSTVNVEIEIIFSNRLAHINVTCIRC